MEKHGFGFPFDQGKENTSPVHLLHNRGEIKIERINRFGNIGGLPCLLFNFVDIGRPAFIIFKRQICLHVHDQDRKEQWVHCQWCRFGDKTLQTRNRFSVRFRNAVQEGVGNIFLGIPERGQTPEWTVMEHCAKDIGYKY